MKIYSMDEYNTKDQKVYSMDEYNELYPRKEITKTPKAGLLKTTGKTILAGTNYLGQGVLKGIEGIGDTLLQVGSSKVNPYYWFNPDKLKEHQAITKDIIKEDATRNLVNTLSGDKNFNQNVLDKDSLIKEENLGGAVAKSIGQMLPSIAIGSGMGAGTKLAENVGLGVMGVQSFGGGLEEAYNQGANRGQATSYALMDSAIETATEKMFAGIGGVLGKGALDDAIKTKLTKKMSNAVAKKLTEYGLDMVGEGVEELASDLLQPLAQKLTYANDKEIKKLYQDQNYLEDFVAGALSAGVMQGVRLPSDIRTAVKENATKKATQAKLPGTRTEQSISNNIEELKQEQQATTDNKLKQEYATKISGLEQELNQFKLPMASTEGMTLQESASKYNIKPETQSNVQQLMDNRNIESRWDATKFKDNSVNALWSKDANGNRQVIFNPNASLDTIVEEVAVHELTHDILSSANTTLNPTEILDYVSQLDGYNEARQSLIDTYKDMYDVNSAEFNSLIDEEVVADVLGRKLGNQEFIDNLVNSKPSIAKSIYNWVVSKLNSIINKGQVRSEKLYWQNIKNNFENAYRQEYKNNETASTKYKVSDINNDNQQDKIVLSDGRTYNNYYDFAKDITKNNEDLSKELLFKYYTYNFNVPANSNETSFYHGTDSLYNYDDFKIMDFNEQTMDRNYGDYFYITPNKSIANEYGKQIAQFIIPNNKIMSLEEYRNTNKTEEELFKDYWAIEMPDNEYIVKNPKQIIDYSKNKAQEYINKQTQGNQITKDNQGRTLSKQQQEFFKDSKVVDRDGNLMVMYHRTEANVGLPENEKFTVFDRDKAGNNGTYYGSGFYFTPYSETAQDYAKSKGNVYETYLNMTNPYIPSADTINKDGSVTFAPTFYEDFENRFKDDISLIIDWSTLTNKQKGRVVRNILQDNGYDGVINGDTYVVFEPNQIKNVDNTNPTTDDDIRYSKESKEWDKWKDTTIQPEGTKTKLKDIKLPTKEVKLPKTETKKITEELADLYQQTKVQVQDENVKGTSFNTLLGYGDKTVLIQVKGDLKNINGVEVGIYKDLSGNWHVVDLKSNFALDRANYKSQKDAIENATNVINNFDLDKLRKNVQKRKSEAIDLTNYTQDDFINAEYDENGIGYPIKEEKPNLPKSKTLPMVKEQTNASEIANEINNITKSRGLVKTLTESDALKGKVLIEDLDPQKINYVVQTNKSSLDKANNTIDTLGYDKSLDRVKQLINDEKLPSASDVALMQRMIQEAAKRGDVETVQDLIMDTAIVGTDLGQATQALSIIQKLTPEGQLKMYTKLVQRAKVRGENSFKDVEITPKMAKNILDAYKSDGTYDQQDLNNRVEQFKQEIANQMKTTTGEKVNAWRYLAMLGNPKTHIRNIVSNVAMNGTIKVKNAMARTLESVLPIANRTKTWKQASTEIQNYANKTANEMKDIITGEAKYNEKTTLEAKKQIFKNKTLEKISDFNSNALEAEDWFFSKMAFKNTLQEYLTANGINTLEDIKNNPEVVEKAKIYAIEQAEIATFRQYSKLASAVNSLEKNNKAARLFIEATMPFKKTPINVAKAGVKYSPLGLIKAISYDIYQVKQGNMEASQFIDNLSQGLTGTSLALLGYALAKAGKLNGSGDDDKEGKYDSQLGENQYSLKIGDKSYSISWLSPVAMPLLVGANAYEQLEGKEEWDMNVVSDTLAKTLDPLNEMSFMQGLTNALTSYGSGVDKIKGSLESVAQNYVGQFFPTLFSQFASTIDDKKRSTKASANSTYKFGEQTLRSVMYKLPGLRQQLEVATDIWGNEKEQADNIIQRAYESFLAPYSTTKNITSNLDKEIKRVYNETGENGVIPGIPYAYVKYGDETYRMSANEYTKYKKTYGTAANSTLNSLINSSSYKNVSDEEKAKMIDNVYDYARAKANKEYFDSINVSYENKTLDKLNTLKSEFGVSPSTYYANKGEYDYAYTNPDKYKTIKQITSYDKYTQYKNKITEIKDNTTNDKQETIKYINSLNLNIPQKAMLIKQYYKSFTQYDSEIIKYINSQNLSKEDKQTILGQLGFVIRDGRVYSK